MQEPEGPFATGANLILKHQVHVYERPEMGKGGCSGEGKPCEQSIVRLGRT